ncbi:MAG: CsgE family curli-type amyloid fiber assembly protein [Bacillota bacterium]
MRQWLIAVLSAITMSAAQAAAEEAAVRPQELYAGVVLDQTVTVVGHEFYQYFAALWRDKETSERYAISVHERPSARLGSQLWVEYAQRRVFQIVLQATRANVKDIGREAADIVFQNVMDIEVQRLMSHDRDIAPDEL